MADVADLAAFEVTLAWNPGIVRVDGVALGEFLGSTGREVVPVEPVIDNDAGHLRFAAASIGRPAGPRMGAACSSSPSSRGSTVGATGLEIDASGLTRHPGGRASSTMREHGRIRVGECMFGDFDCNCVIDIRDVMAVVRRWGTVEGDPDFDATYDLDDDGDIDIVDVQIVASLWGRRCENEIAPEPVRPVTGDDDQTVEGHDGPDSGPEIIEYGDVVLAPLGAKVQLTPDTETPRVGEQVQVAVHLSEAGEVAGFELHLAYDAARLRFVDGEVGAFLHSTGRTVVPLGPEVGDGTLMLGAFSFPGQPAPQGAGLLATITFEVLAPGETVIAVTDATVVDPMEVADPIGAASVTVSAVRGEPVGAAIVPFAARAN